MSDDRDFDMEVVENKVGMQPDNGAVEKEESSSTSRNLDDLPEIERVPDGWELNTIEEVAEDVVGGGTPSKSNEDYWGGEIPWASVKDLDGVAVQDTEDYITEEGAKNSATNLISSGSVVISTRMTVGEAFMNLVDMAINQDLKAIKPDDSRVNTHFLVYALRGKDRYLKSLGRGTTVSGITTADLKRTHLARPPLPEQRKIASVLYAVDQAIQKTEAIIEQAKRVKRGLMQDVMESGLHEHDLEETETRFGALPRSWEVKRLKELGKIAGRTAPEKEDSECWGGEIPWATPSEITNLEGNTIERTEEYLTERALEKVSSNLLPPGSVLLTTRATVGACAVNTVPMTTNQGFKNVIPGENLDTWYAYHRLIYEADQLEARAKGSTFREVGKETVENFEIPIPPLAEQQEIGQILKSVDNQILNNKATVSKYERLKKGLMQDLLTGEVPTADKAIEVLDEVAARG